jgi:putative glycosyltransferase (TIGR04372 family)
MTVAAILQSMARQIRANGALHRIVRAAAHGLETFLSWILYLARVRFLLLTAPGRIGHLSTDPGIFVKRRKLGMDGWSFGVLICPRGVAANECLLDYWRRYITVVQSPLLTPLFTRLTRFKYLEYDARTHAINETSPHIEVERRWNRGRALLRLTDGHRREGRAVLERLGVPYDAEFVCIHCREPGFSPSDDDSQAYRDSNIENYASTIAELTARSIWCIRMGGPTTRPLAPRDKLIDYAHSNARSEQMDIFLPAACKFFLGGSSGLIFVANVFGRATGSSNHAPLSTVVSFGPEDVAIPKLLYAEAEGRYLTFAEAFSSDAGNLRYQNLYQERGLRTIENTADEIRAVAMEMLERAEGRAHYTRKDEELQARFKSLMRPGHYSYGGVTRVGRDFLRKYEHLLE